MTDIRNFLQENGFSNLPDHIILDGTIHRWSADDKAEKDEWYVGREGVSLKGNPWQCIKAGSWSSGKFATCEYKSWKSGDIDYKELESHFKQVTQECRKKEEDDKALVGQRAKDVWQSAKETDSHPYLTSKGVKSYGLRILNDALVIPIGEPMCGLQFISPDGDKRMMKGSQVKGNSYVIKGTTDVIGIAEGYSTGATVHESLGITIYISFGAQNLTACAKKAQDKYPDSTIVIFADNDETGRKEGNLAAAAVKGAVLIPPTEGNDWNDEGTEALKELYDPKGMLFFDGINKRFAILHGQKEPALIRFDKECEEGFKIISPASFRAEMEGTKHPFLEKPADEWLKSLHARRYCRIDFNPKGNCSPDTFNLWQGFGIEPKEGDDKIQTFIYHVDNIICRGDKTLSCYLWNWMARLVQTPWDQTNRSALVIIGEQGTGKSMFVEMLGNLFGKHFFKSNDSEKTLSRFGLFQLQAKILVFMDESSWNGNQQQANQLKSLITSDTISGEKKGADVLIVKNYANFIFCSNDLNPVSIDARDRRFVVFKMSNAKINDISYFKRLSDEMKSGGYEQLMNKLMKHDTTDFWAQIKPETEESFEIKINSASSVIKYIYSFLQDGELLGLSLDNELGIKATKTRVYDDYLQFCSARKLTIINDTHFWRQIKKNINYDTFREMGCQRKAVFPSLEKMRRTFEISFNTDRRIWD